MNRMIRHALILMVLVVGAMSTGCAKPSTERTIGRVVLTPVTGARDIVDVPLVSITNVFNVWAQRTNPNPVPGAGVGWTLRGGVSPYAGIDLSHYVFLTLTAVFGSVDYILCRSIYPNPPKGISPWKRRDESWGHLYFPNTRALWGYDFAEHESQYYGTDREDRAPPE